ncbi:hypothetical protein KZ813_16795 [Sphingomonas sp. RHCKR7]|uniref:hypothetical protein n=1 Tax=Sphingomonas folli TaxID=2862497 RepID=UPI001CA5372B|nr:hypothetical protein [Sphingomonas folli]MBW6528503.1 hypothetical protein [Sphingomonas folli]
MTAPIIFVMCWVTLICASRTPLGRLLNRVAVEIPAKALNRLGSGHVALVVVVTTLVVVHLHTEGSDPIRMVALVAPDIVVWLASVEISAVFEGLAAATAAAAALSRAGRLSFLIGLRSRCSRFLKSKANGGKKRRPRKRKPPANDYEEGAASRKRAEPKLSGTRRSSLTVPFELKNCTSMETLTRGPQIQQLTGESIHASEAARNAAGRDRHRLHPAQRLPARGGDQDRVAADLAAKRTGLEPQQAKIC